jgi:predicted permease
MGWFRRVKTTLRAARLEEDLHDEVAFHIEKRVEELMAQGVPEEEARRQVALRFGGAALTVENARHRDILPWLEIFAKDAAIAARSLARTPGFLVVALVSLALGVGANTAIFSVIDAVALRSIPVRNPHELFFLENHGPRGVDSDFNYRMYKRLSETRSLAAYGEVALSVEADGQTLPLVAGQLVSGNYFSTLGVDTVLGRTIDPDDVHAESHPVAVVSHSFWKNQFGSDASVIGKRIRLCGRPFTVIGVAEPGFGGVDVGVRFDISVPISMQPWVMPAYGSLLDNPSNNVGFLVVFGRTPTGESPKRGIQALSPAYREVADEFADVFFRGKPAAAEYWRQSKLAYSPGELGRSPIRTQFARSLWILLALVGLVLLLACVNLAGLLVARAATRRREYAVRLAIGAGRGRLIRQGLIESGVIAAGGTLLGLAAAQWSAPALIGFLSVGRIVPIALDTGWNPRLLLYTMFVAVLVTLLAGLLPAVRATQTAPADALQGRATTGGSPRSGRWLAGAQVALSCTMMVVAGLLVRTFVNLNLTDSGADRQNVLILQLEPPGSDNKNRNADRLHADYEAFLRDVRGVPGVRSASLAGLRPTGRGNITIPVSQPGDATKSEQARATQVYPGYFPTLGMRLVAGREFADADMLRNAPRVAVINETLARRLFGDANPIGRPLKEWRSTAEIIGVVEDNPYDHYRAEAVPSLYLPFLQTSTGRGQMTLHARISGSAASVSSALLQRVRQRWPIAPPFPVRTLAEEVDSVLIREQLLAGLSGFFATVALLLAAIGLYGLLAYTVARRTSEIGVRMALGADRRKVVLDVVRQSVVITIAAATVGLAGAAAATRWIASLLYGISATDFVTFGLSAAVLLVAAVIAALVPAWRAAAVDPLTALRAD